MFSTLNAFLLATALAQPIAPLARDEVLATLGEAAVTVADVDAAFTGLPGEIAERWVGDPGLIGDEMTRLLLNRAIAEDVLAGGAPPIPDAAARARSAADRELADRWLDARITELVEPITEQDVRARYEARPRDFLAPPRRTVRQLFVSTKYQSEPRARAEIEGLARELATGEATFDELFDEYAAAIESGARGAVVLEDLRPEQPNVDPAFAEAAWALEAPGAVSDPVRTSFGFHLVELREVVPERPRPFARVVGPLEEQLHRDRMAAARQELLAPFDRDRSVLADRLRASAFAGDPMVAAAMRQAADAALVRAVREVVMTVDPADARMLARERYLAARTPHEEPARVTFRAVALDPAVVGEARLAALAEQFGDAAPSEWPDLRDFLYDHLFGEVDYEPIIETRALPDLPDAIRTALGPDGPAELPAQRVVEADGLVQLVQVVAWEPGAPVPFESVAETLTAEVARNLASQRWRVFVDPYHRTPLKAEPERIALLRQRYAEGLPGLAAPALAAR